MPTNPNSTSIETMRVHVVQPGDTLWQIAKEELSTEITVPTDKAIMERAKELMRINGISNPRMLMPGQRIFFSQSSNASEPYTAILAPSNRTR